MHIIGVKLRCKILAFLVAGILLTVLPLTSTTIVQKCTSGAEDNYKFDNQVFISGCYEPPCKLRKNSTITIEMYFIPEYDVNRLQSSVYAWIYAIPLPYLGVDGKSACNNLYNRDGSRASCPLRKGQQYIYKNTIDIKATYPKVKVVLHWALLDERNNANVFCFEVPVKIVASK